LACKNYEVEKVKTMLQFATIEEINHIEPNGSTALHVASYYGHVEIVELLLQAGASQTNSL
jgi:ankyrin repeat protein